MKMRSTFSSKLRSYFADLSLFTRTELGVEASTRRQIWIAVCYFSFSIGVFSRQVSTYPQIGLIKENARWDVLIGSVIVGLAIFPFVLRHIINLAAWIVGKVVPNDEFYSKESLNLIHVIVSFSMGYFVNLSYEAALHVLKTQIAAGQP